MDSARLFTVREEEFVPELTVFTVVGPVEVNVSAVAVSIEENGEDDGEL